MRVSRTHQGPRARSPRFSTHTRGRVLFKAASGISTSYSAANIDARALGRYLKRSMPLELPTKARQAILRCLGTAAGPEGRGASDPVATSGSGPPRAGEGFQAVCLNLWRGLAGKVQASGSCLRGWGYPDVVGLQEVGKLPASMVAHAMYWAAFTQAAHPAGGVGILICWRPTVLEVGMYIPVGKASPWYIGAAGGASWPWWSISPPTRLWTWCGVSSRGS